MRFPVLPLLILCCASAAQAQGGAGSRAAGDLRTAIKQVNESLGGAVRPRQLSEEERAELRRQLSQHSRGRH
jgi:hypothetical protein